MKHKMWSRLLSMVLAVMMITSIVPTSAFAEAASEIAASSQAVAEVVEQTEEVTLPEDTTTEEPAAETPAQEPAAETPAEEPAGEPVPTAEPVAEPTAEPATESEQPTAEPTQAPAETAVPSEQPSVEPTAAPEGTETPEATAVPSATPVPSESPLPSETPVPSETPAPTETPEATEEPVAMNEEAYETTADVENADITVTVNVPAGALPVNAELKADLIAEETEEFAQAQAALDEQQVEYDGMIALDIRFELNGEEIEPLYPVEVTIDAKAMLPENVDPETVTVQHLKEDESGEVVAVETVADATEETGDVTVAATQNEEAAMDMASTFAVDGFSTFTVAYGLLAAPRANNGVSLQLVYEDEDEDKIFDVQLEDENGEELLLETPLNLVVEFKDGFKTITFQNIVDATEQVYSGEKLIGTVTGTPINTITVDGATYKYVRTDISNDTDANGLQYRGENWQYKKSNGEFSELNNDQIITFVYEKQASTEKPDFTPIQTVDTNAKGIELKLFNYNKHINGGSESDEVAGNRALTFKNDGEGVDGTNKKRDEHNNPAGWLYADKYGGGLAQGIVQNTLKEGYPVTSAGTDGNRSLRYLFDEDYDTGNDNLNKAVTEYPANFLFTYNSETGYYEYDSAKNAANYDTQSNRFNVYNYTEAANTESGKENEGSFLPFNNAQAADAKGSWSDRKFLFEEETVDYWFGMSMTAEFIQPKGGKVNGQEMVFEFTGDDDVWVFIDGKLVLDLGGVHSAVSGTINFATGEVSIKDTTEAAVQNVPSLNEIFALGEGNSTFEDYSTHTIEYFYLERGGDVANCHIKFNLPTIPEEDLAVAKKVTQTGTNDTINADTQFDFVLKNGDAPVMGQKYVVYNLDAYTQDPTNPGSAEGTGETVEGGHFKLKAGQVAVFEDIIQAGSEDVYTVFENLTEEQKENISAVYVDGVDSPDRTTTLTATDRYTLFDNWVTDTGEYQLSLTKQWKNQSGSTLAAAAIPFTKVKVTVEQYYRTGDGSTTSSVNPQVLELTAENGWEAYYTKPVENYTAFRVLREEVYIDDALIVTHSYDYSENGQGILTTTWGDDKYQDQYSEWEIGGFEFQRDYSAEGTEFKVEPSNAELNIQIPASGCVIVRNTNEAVIWTPYLDIMSDAAKNALLTMVENSKFDKGWGSVNKYYLMDDTLPSSLNGARETLKNLKYSDDGSIVSIVFKRTSEWNKVAYGGISVESGEISASLTNTLNTSGTIDINVEKKWKNGEGIEIPAGANSVTIQLLKDDTVVSGETLTLSDTNYWKGSFQNLAKYNADGTPIAYTVDEVEVTGYTSTITCDMQNSFTITNTPSEGYLKINKIIQGNKFGNGKDVFSFKIEDEDGKTWYMHVDGAGDAKVDGTQDTLTLDAGEYTVTELDNINYTFTSVNAEKDGVDEGDADIEKRSITVTVSGNETTQVTFINTPEPTNVPSDGSAVINGMQKINDNKFTLIFEQKKELGQTAPQTTTSD